MVRRLIFFLITAFIAVLIVVLINSALKTKEARIQALQHGQMQIVVAARSLAPGNVLEASNVKLAAWPRDHLPPGAVTSTDQVQGQVLKEGVIENQPIVQEMLLQHGKGGGVLPFLIPNGMRAMSIPVTPVSDMAGMILPHTRVDVLVTSGETGGSSDRTRIVLQNLEVLAVQTTLEAAGNEPQRTDVVTLLVTPTDAERLAAAIRLGTIQLAMRSYADQQPAWTAGVNSRELLGLPPVAEQQQSPATISAQQQSAAAMPARGAARPRAQISVEVIRNGKERTTVNFARNRSPVTNPGISTAVDPPQIAPGDPAAPVK
jgi:pilus assembly protein CpaB